MTVNCGGGGWNTEIPANVVNVLQLIVQFHTSRPSHLRQHIEKPNKVSSCQNRCFTLKEKKSQMLLQALRENVPKVRKHTLSLITGRSVTCITHTHKHTHTKFHSRFETVCHLRARQTVNNTSQKRHFTEIASSVVLELHIQVLHCLQGPLKCHASLLKETNAALRTSRM